MPKRNDRFARVEQWVGAALLTLAIIITFGSLAQRRQPQLALESTPPTPTVEPYPPPVQPPASTFTPGPYPPPASPIPTPTPTAIPTPMPTLPIAPNLGIIWAETRFTSGEESRPEAIDFWEATIADLVNKHRLFSLQEGHQLRNVELSPDGQRVAFVTCPRIGCDDDETVLWIARKDGSELRNVAQGVDKFAQYIRYPVWSPDSQAVAYIRSVLKTPAPVDKDTEPAIKEVFVAPIGGGEPRSLVADDLIMQILGWSQGGESLFYERSAPGVGYELWATGVDPQTSPPICSLFVHWLACR